MNTDTGNQANKNTNADVLFIYFLDIMSKTFLRLIFLNFFNLISCFLKCVIPFSFILPENYRSYMKRRVQLLVSSTKVTFLK